MSSAEAAGVILFVAATTVLIVVSRQSLRRVRSHGFYRFLAWETLLVMFLLNVQGWFLDPLAWHQVVSWVLLMLSLALVILGVRLLRKTGGQDLQRDDPSLLGMEKTSRLVTAGVYRYIRHPLYSSLLLLGWGIFFKSPSWLDAGLALLCTLFLTTTARLEERENIDYFGPAYVTYMKRTKMFVPWVF